MSREFPWSPGSATGIGSLPDTDISEAVKVVFGELPSLPHLPELPARGPGADMIGRTAGILVDLPVELYVARWRVASRPGRDLGYTRDLLERDLDALGLQAADFAGPVKLQAAGPWTMAASVDLPVGGRMLRDPGAVRDLVASLVEGIAVHVRDVAARLPHARILLQLDEPSLPAVLAGHVRTESGYSTFRAVDVPAARTALAMVIEGAGVPVIVHCCAADAPISLVREAGAAGIALDLDLVADLDELGEALDAGLGLFAGAVPAGGAGVATASVADTGAQGGDSRESDFPAGSPAVAEASLRAATKIRELWHKIGFSVNDLAAQVVVTPACGLAGASQEQARIAMATCRQAGNRLADD